MKCKYNAVHKYNALQHKNIGELQYRIICQCFSLCKILEAVGYLKVWMAAKKRKIKLITNGCLK